MEPFSKRAFCLGLVLFTFTLLVIFTGSTADDSPNNLAHSVNDKDKGSPQTVNVVESKGSSNPKEINDSSKNAVTVVKKPTATSDSLDKANCTAGSNDTNCVDDRSFYTRMMDKMTKNRDMLFRTMYVLLGVTGIVIIYFVVKAVRLRRRRSKSRKYGVITTRGDVEMEPLGEGDDEDEDYTVFEMNGRTK